MSGGTHYIPNTDEDFDTFFKQFHDSVTTNPSGLGLAASDVVLVQSTYATWIVVYPGHKDAQLKAQQATTTKNKGRDEAEASIRSLVKKINGNPNVDNAMRAQAALPPHDPVKSTIGAPTTRPVGRTEAKGHLTVVVHFTDENTPLQLAKPHGVHACEIRFFVGSAPPADETGYTFLAHDTRTPYTDVHPAADAGKTVYYILRWLNAKLEPGPWSDVVFMKIPV